MCTCVSVCVCVHACVHSEEHTPERMRRRRSRAGAGACTHVCADVSYAHTCVRISWSVSEGLRVSFVILYIFVKRLHCSGYQSVFFPLLAVCWDAHALLIADRTHTCASEMTENADRCVRVTTCLSILISRIYALKNITVWLEQKCIRKKYIQCSWVFTARNIQAHISKFICLKA